MSYTRPTYVLTHRGTTLLILDAGVTPPLVLGERVEPFNATTQTSDGVYVVTGIRRRLPYYEREPVKAPLAGQIIMVEVEPLEQHEGAQHA